MYGVQRLNGLERRQVLSILSSTVMSSWKKEDAMFLELNSWMVFKEKIWTVYGVQQLK